MEAKAPEKEPALTMRKVWPTAGETIDEPHIEFPGNGSCATHLHLVVAASRVSASDLNTRQPVAILGEVTLHGEYSGRLTRAIVPLLMSFPLMVPVPVTMPPKLNTFPLTAPSSRKRAEGADANSSTRRLIEKKRSDIYAAATSSIDHAVNE